MTERDVDQRECIWCRALFTPHPKDGIDECPECAAVDWSQLDHRVGTDGSRSQVPKTPHSGRSS